MQSSVALSFYPKGYPEVQRYAAQWKDTDERHILSRWRKILAAVQQPV
jgi:hypothetical protein